MNPRDALLARNKRRYKKSEVDIGSNGEAVYLRWRNLSEMEKSSFEQVAASNDKMRSRSARLNLRLRVIVACAVDDDGKMIFCDADIPRLQEIDGSITQSLSDEAMMHVGWTENDMEQLVALEDNIKNLPETHDDASLSD
jgi:hypothetical protein